MLLTGCPDSQEATYSDPKTPPALVTEGSFSQQALLTGTIKSANSAPVSSPTGAWGLSIRWMAQSGVTVKKGDKVLSMDTSELVRDIETAKQAVLKSRQDLLQERQTGKIQLAEKEHALYQSETTLAKARLDLDVPKGSYPRRTFENMQLALERSISGQLGAKQALAAEKRITANSTKEKTIAVSTAERKLGALQEKLSTYILLAPRDGLLVVAENRREGRPFKVGDKTWPGQTVVELPDLSSMVVEAQLSDVDDGSIYTGMKVHCILDAYPSLRFAGQIKSISPVAHAPGYRSIRRIFDVVVQLDETDTDKMRPGMSVRVEVKGPVKEKVTLIPRSSLLFSDDGVKALLASGQESDVEIGSCSVEQCIVVSGLSVGTKLGNRSER